MTDMPPRIVDLGAQRTKRRAPEPDELVIAALEDLLARAKSGEITYIAGIVEAAEPEDIAPREASDKFRVYGLLIDLANEILREGSDE